MFLRRLHNYTNVTKRIGYVSNINYIYKGYNITSISNRNYSNNVISTRHEELYELGVNANPDTSDSYSSFLSCEEEVYQRAS